MAQGVKNLPAMQRPGFNPWVGKIPGRRKWIPTLVFLPGGFQGQRSLVGYSPRGRKEWDETEQLTLSLSFCLVLGHYTNPVGLRLGLDGTQSDVSNPLFILS